MLLLTYTSLFKIYWESQVIATTIFKKKMKWKESSIVITAGWLCLEVSRHINETEKRDDAHTNQDMRNESCGYRKRAYDKRSIRAKGRRHVFNTWSAAGGHILGGCGNAGRLA